MGWDDVIFNDNTPITCKTTYYYSSIKTGSFTPGELTSKYALEASSRSFMNTLANFWLIVPASGKNDGYYCVFGYTFPTDKPIDIINNYQGYPGYLFFHWEGMTANNTFGTNAHYYRQLYMFNNSQTGNLDFNYSGDAYNYYSEFRNNITINGNTYQGNIGYTLDNTYKPVIITSIPQENFTFEGVPIISYNWSSVPAISGKMGILSCPALYEDSDGNPVTDGTRQDFAKLPDSSLLSQLCQKIYNDEQIIAYSGEDNKLSCTWTSATTFALKWYIHDVQIASITYTLANASDDVWIHMLFDKSGADDPEPHAWARPSIVIRNSVTGYYSWNTESVDSGLFDTFYEWIYGSQKDWGDAILGDFNEEAGGDDYNIPSDDPIPEPAMPTISSLNLNMTKMYKCTKDIINSFWSWLCDDNVQIGNKLFTADPLQGVIGINIVPFDISADGNPEICYLGLHTNVYAPRVTDQFQEIDCGTFKVPKYMYGTYLDYSPFTKIKCVIPYIGIIDLDTDDVSGKTLQLKLRYDVLTGVCIAHLYVNNALHYEAAGNININVPMTQKDYTQIANTIKGVVSRLGGSTSQAIGMGAISGNAAAAGVGIGSSLVASGLELAMAKPSYRYIQGGAGASAAFMGIDRPFLLFQIPTLARPESDEKFIGMPSYIKDKIGSFKGFAKFKNPHIDNVACTASEKAKIEQFLQAGIINQVGTDKESTTPSNTPTTTGNTVITFIKNQSDNNVMGKTFNTTQHAIEGKLLYDHSITQPVFLISGNVIDYNYAYIGDFNRFYYITDVITKAHGMCEVHFDCDVLQSFKASIKECDGICERSQNRNNMYINDNALITQQNAYVFTKQFSKTGVRFNFAKGNACYTLILADA